MADQTASGWDRLLDEMEAALSTDAATLPWSEPEPFEPLPTRLMDRAQLLIEAQQRAIGALADERTRVARHLIALRTVPSSTSGRSVYLDVVG